MAQRSAETRKSLKVSAETHARLEDLKPFDSMSFDELIEEMADTYAEVRR